MAEDRMALLETIRKVAGDSDIDFLREGVRVLAEAVMEAEVGELTGVANAGSDAFRSVKTATRTCRSRLSRTSAVGSSFASVTRT